MVAASEVGGRWDEESYQFLVHMAKSRSRQAPLLLRSSLVTAWVRRWTGMLTHAAQSAFAAPLVQEDMRTESGGDGEEPAQGVLLTI